MEQSPDALAVIVCGPAVRVLTTIETGFRSHGTMPRLVLPSKNSTVSVRDSPGAKALLPKWRRAVIVTGWPTVDGLGSVSTITRAVSRLVSHASGSA